MFLEGMPLFLVCFKTHYQKVYCLFDCLDWTWYWPAFKNRTRWSLERHSPLFGRSWRIGSNCFLLGRSLLQCHFDVVHLLPLGVFLAWTSLDSEHCFGTTFNNNCAFRIAPRTKTEQMCWNAQDPQRRRITSGIEKQSTLQSEFTASFEQVLKAAYLNTFRFALAITGLVRLSGQ